MLKHNPLPCFVTMLVGIWFLLYEFGKKSENRLVCALKSSHVKNGCVSPHPDGLCIDAYNKNRHHCNNKARGCCVLACNPRILILFWLAGRKGLQLFCSQQTDNAQWKDNLQQPPFRKL